jgi:hypothetical protein
MYELCFQLYSNPVLNVCFDSTMSEFTRGQVLGQCINVVILLYILTYSIHRARHYYVIVETIGRFAVLILLWSCRFMTTS